MTVNNPIKRNENLVVLSHEHHHGLVFCSRLKKANQTDDETLKAFVKDFWNKHLAAHLASEEKLLLPLLPDNAIVAQFVFDHYHIRKLIEAILKNDIEVAKEVVNLSKLINDHIRFEERTMFPWLEKVLTSDKLIVVGNELESTEITKHQFSPEFWKNEN